MSESKKFFVSSALALSTMVATALFYHNTFILIPLLAIIGAMMLFPEFKKIDFFFYVLVFTLGPLAESLVISFGGWSYTMPQLLGFPLWLPFVWGNAGIFIKRLYLFSLHVFPPQN